MFRCIRCSAMALAMAVVLVPPAVAQTVFSANGVVESKSGGFKFPDGSVQDAAAVPLGTCPTVEPTDEMIWVGGVCIDKYEASLWDAPTGGNQIPNAQIDDYCPEDGQPLGSADCEDFYARSVAGVQPTGSITWFQAQQALANSGKRLPTNAEWQMAVSGTPDTGGADDGSTSCNTDVSGPGPALTGSRSACVSRHGAFDMVGNLWEWVADWVPASTTCLSWGVLSNDFMCVTGASTTTPGPGVLLRGGNWNNSTAAGPLAVSALNHPTDTFSDFGFRGAR